MGAPQGLKRKEQVLCIPYGGMTRIRFKGFFSPLKLQNL
jgi:hypothetical protein